MEKEVGWSSCRCWWGDFCVGVGDVDSARVPSIVCDFGVGMRRKDSLGFTMYFPLNRCIQAFHDVFPLNSDVSPHFFLLSSFTTLKTTPYTYEKAQIHQSTPV